MPGTISAAQARFIAQDIVDADERAALLDFIERCAQALADHERIDFLIQHPSSARFIFSSLAQCEGGHGIFAAMVDKARAIELDFQRAMQMDCGPAAAAPAASATPAAVHAASTVTDPAPTTRSKCQLFSRLQLGRTPALIGSDQ